VDRLQSHLRWLMALALLALAGWAVLWLKTAGVAGLVA
jgi:hypothetical protein